MLLGGFSQAGRGPLVRIERIKDIYQTKSAFSVKNIYKICKTVGDKKTTLQHDNNLNTNLIHQIILGMASEEDHCDYVI